MFDDVDESTLLGRFSRITFDKPSKKADCREQRREETFESTHDSKSYLREVGGSVKTLQSRGKKEKKEKYRRSFRWSNFSQWLTMGIWTKNGEKALTGEWRERNDRKTDTL